MPQQSVEHNCVFSCQTPATAYGVVIEVAAVEVEEVIVTVVVVVMAVTAAVEAVVAFFAHEIVGAQRPQQLYPRSISS